MNLAVHKEKDFQNKIKYMNEKYWLIKSSRSRVKRFTKNKKNKDKFFE